MQWAVDWLKPLETRIVARGLIWTGPAGALNRDCAAGQLQALDRPRDIAMAVTDDDWRLTGQEAFLGA